MTAEKDKRAAPRRAEEMFPIMEQFEASGQTQQAFRQAHGFSRSGFQYWLRRYRQSKQGQASEAGAFIPLKIAQGPSAKGFRNSDGLAAKTPQVVIHFGDGTQVEVHGQVEASFIRQILGR